jgi:hypothetical protein
VEADAHSKWLHGRPQNHIPLLLKCSQWQWPPVVYHFHLFWRASPASTHHPPPMHISAGQPECNQNLSSSPSDPRWQSGEMSSTRCGEENLCTCDLVINHSHSVRQLLPHKHPWFTVVFIIPHPSRLKMAL